VGGGAGRVRIPRPQRDTDAATTTSTGSGQGQPQTGAVHSHELDGGSRARPRARLTPRESIDIYQLTPESKRARPRRAQRGRARPPVTVEGLEAGCAVFRRQPSATRPPASSPATTASADDCGDLQRRRRGGDGPPPASATKRCWRRRARPDCVIPFRERVDPHKGKPLCARSTSGSTRGARGLQVSSPEQPRRSGQRIATLTRL